MFIPTFNGEDYLEDLLSSVLSQEIPLQYDVLIIDSGSSDSTLDIIKNFPTVKLHEIPNAEFGHGKTRNLAASMSSADYMVYLSQDAVPANNHWLEAMVEPFIINSDVVAVFGKQVPRPHSDAPTKREVSTVFNSLGPEHSIMINRKSSLISQNELWPALTFFSDVNSAVRRDFLVNKLPYRDVQYSEDQLFGVDVLDKGLMKAYSSQGIVMHSNEYALKDYFYRKFDEYLGMYDSLGVLPGGSLAAHIKRWVYDTLKDIPFIIRDADYTYSEKIANLLTSWIRNYYRQKASYIVNSEERRERSRSKLSLEAKSKN